MRLRLRPPLRRRLRRRFRELLLLPGPATDLAGCIAENILDLAIYSHLLRFESVFWSGMTMGSRRKGAVRRP